MSARSGDAELRIVFNASEKSFTIDDVVDSKNVIKASLGYETADIVGKNLAVILPGVIKQSIDEYLEVDGTDCNIVSILSRTRNFALLSENGESVQLIMRIQPDVSVDECARYRMVVRDNARASDGLFKALDSVTEYEVLDSVLDVSTEEFFYKKIDVVRDYILKRGAKATLAMINIDKYDGVLEVFGDGTCVGLLHEVVARCRTSFREADIIGYFGGGCLGVLLLDAGTDSARIPLNRLRSLIENQPMFYGENRNIKATISIALSELDPEKNSQEMVEVCNKALEQNVDQMDVIIAV